MIQASGVTFPGVTTFMVSQHGQILETDLGPDTATLVDEIQAYDPDESWTVVEAE